jgi:transposase-like protein
VPIWFWLPTAGGGAPIQRCQVHKRRNVLDHLTDEQKPTVAKKLNAAYALEDYGAAKQALNTLHRELMDVNPSAARSWQKEWKKR